MRKRIAFLLSLALLLGLLCGCAPGFTQGTTAPATEPERPTVKEMRCNGTATLLRADGEPAGTVGIRWTAVLLDYPTQTDCVHRLLQTADDYPYALPDLENSDEDAGGGAYPYFSASTVGCRKSDGAAVQCRYAVDFEREMFLLYWPEVGEYLLWAADAALDAAQILAHFSDFSQTLCA